MITTQQNTKQPSTKPLKVYCCAECGAVEKRTTAPIKSKCVSSSFHRWTQVGESGNNAYCCNLCKTTIMTKAIPSSYGCRESTFHIWEKL